jgi:hypothetical protein
MTGKQTEVIRDFLLQYFDCFTLLGFDVNGDSQIITGSDSPLKEHSLRKQAEDVVNGELIDMIFPSTGVSDGLDVEWYYEDDDDDGEEWAEE